MIWIYNISKHYLKNLSIKSNAIKTWRFGDDISPLSNANKKGTKILRYEKQKNEITRFIISGLCNKQREINQLEKKTFEVIFRISQAFYFNLQDVS